MLAAGVKNPNVLDELESHLREDVERLARSGSNMEQAFETAVGRIGQGGPLKREFAKVGAAKGTRRQGLKSALLRFIGMALPPPDAFTACARETLELGGKEALGLHHHFIGTEHVLLGLLELKTGVVCGVLHRLGVDRKIVRTEIEKVVGPGPAEQMTEMPPYTPRVKKALAIAGSEARALNHTHVGAEHIFLGLLLEGGGVAARVLKNLGVNIQTAREEIQRELGGI